METKTMPPLDPTMCKWCLSVVNADTRSAFEFVKVSGFRAPTTDEAQRAWLNLTELEYGLAMPISSLILDAELVSKKLPAPGSDEASRPNDPYANREMARVTVGVRELSLDEYLRQQRLVNHGARAASLLLFNAGMYIYRHLNAYNKAARAFQPQLFEDEFTLFIKFADTYSTPNTRLEIYDQTTAPATILRQIAFVCWGCRRHCTTFGLPAAASVVHWCGGVVCELAGPLSPGCNPPPGQPQPILELKTPSGNPVNLIRGHGSTDTVVRLTRGTNADESLRLWCAVTSGDLVPPGLDDVWVPSASAWRFRTVWDLDYSDVMSWPPRQRVTQWQPARRVLATTTVTAAAATAPERCKRLCQRTQESRALLALADAILVSVAAAAADIDGHIGRAFPRLTRDATPVTTLARLIYYFQRNSKRMCKATRKAFIDLFLKTKTANIAASDLQPDAVDAAHGDPLEKCCCSKLPSFLTTLSNRVCVAASTTASSRRAWPGSEFADLATELWRRRWPAHTGSSSRTRIQDLKVHIANLNVSMTPTDATNVQKQTEGTRVLAELMGTPLPFAPLDLVLRNRRCPTPLEELLMLAGWTGAMSDDTARMLVAAGVALFFSAILELRGPFSELQASRAFGGDVKWQPAAPQIMEAIARLTPNARASLVEVDADTCSLMCTYLETKWPAIFEHQGPVPAPMVLANQLMQQAAARVEPDPAPVSWSRTPTPSALTAVTDLGSALPLLVDVKHTPEGLPQSNVQLCLELVAVGHRLLGNASVDLSPSLQYAALEPFHRSGLDPANLDEASWLFRTEINARNNDPQLQSSAAATTTTTTTNVDIGDPLAFQGLNSGYNVDGFLFDFDHERSLARRPGDFRITAQRVRQHEFVQHYMRLVAQGAAGGDDVTVMMNMAARLDRMWRRDFPKHGIAGMDAKLKLRGQWQVKFGGDAVHAMKDVAAVLELGSGVSTTQAKAIGAVRAASRTAQYMCIDYKWPATMTPELRRLRHELDLFAYNRRVLPFAMEQLALDIIVVEACCVHVLDTIDATAVTSNAQHAWAIVCFAMFTVFDLRPVFMSMALPVPPQQQQQATSPQTQPPLLAQLDARRNIVDKA